MLVSIKNKLYNIHFACIKNFIEFSTRWHCRSIGLAVGTLALELSSALCVVARRLTYKKTPLEYGVNRFSGSHKGKNPVILIHGRMSRWVDLMDLALTLKCANIPVFFVSLENQTPTEQDRVRIQQEIKNIHYLYFDEFHEKCPEIDIVGHSLGGNMALYAAFTPCCATIDGGRIKFLTHPKGNPDIGRIITLGMPTSSIEMAWMHKVGKKQQIYNIVAKFDAVMGNKKSALKHQLLEVDCGHLGLLSTASYVQVLRWLINP